MQLLYSGVSALDDDLDRKYLKSQLEGCRRIIGEDRLCVLFGSLAFVVSLAAGVVGIFLSVMFLLLPAAVLAVLGALILSLRRSTPRNMSDRLHGCVHEMEYLARVIDARLLDYSEKTIVARGRRKRIAGSNEAGGITLLRGIRYALLVRSGQIRELLASKAAENVHKAFLLASNPLPIYGGATEDPDLLIPVEGISSEMSALLQEIKALEPQAGTRAHAA